MPFEHQHHGVALLDAHFLQRAGRLIGFFGDIAKGQRLFAAVHMLPHERDAIRLRLCDFVQHVERVVEVFRHVHVEVFQIIFIRTKLGLVQKLLVKRHVSPSSYLITTAMKWQSESTAYMAWGMAES